MTVCSCNVTEDHADTIVNINSDFSAELSEVLLPLESNVLLKLATIEKAECESAYLNYRTFYGESKVDIELIGINQPADCDMSYSQSVHTEIGLKKKEDGIYALNLQLLNSFSNHGHLEIQSDRYNLILENNKGFKVKFKTLMKTDKELFWGYFTSENNYGLQDYKEKLLEELGDRANSENLNTGTYNDFFISDNGALTFRNITGINNITPIYFKINNRRHVAISIIESFKAQLPEDVTLHLYTGRGEIF